MKNNPIRILIVDDHPVVREGLAAIINGQPDMVAVGEASDGPEAIAAFRQERPDVTLMDLGMRRMGGVAAITAIRREFSDARIVVLTIYAGDEEIYRALKAGAQAYLLKDAPPEELLRAIRAVHEGRRYIPPSVAVRLAEHVPGPNLTERETEVLKMIVEGMSNKQIAKALRIREGTVKAHVNSILSKLGVSSRSQAIIAALRRDIVHLEQ